MSTMSAGHAVAEEIGAAGAAIGAADALVLGGGGARSMRVAWRGGSLVTCGLGATPLEPQPIARAHAHHARVIGNATV
jgi:hypothetical protein